MNEVGLDITCVHMNHEAAQERPLLPCSSPPGLFLSTLHLHHPAILTINTTTNIGYHQALSSHQRLQGALVGTTPTAS